MQHKANLRVHRNIGHIDELLEQGGDVDLGTLSEELRLLVGNHVRKEEEFCIDVFTRDNGGYSVFATVFNHENGPVNLAYAVPDHYGPLFFQSATFPYRDDFPSDFSLPNVHSVVKRAKEIIVEREAQKN